MLINPHCFFLFTLSTPELLSHFIISCWRVDVKCSAPFVPASNSNLKYRFFILALHGGEAGIANESHCCYEDSQ